MHFEINATYIERQFDLQKQTEIEDFFYQKWAFLIPLYTLF